MKVSLITSSLRTETYSQQDAFVGKNKEISVNTRLPQRVDSERDISIYSYILTVIDQLAVFPPLALIEKVRCPGPMSNNLT